METQINQTHKTMIPNKHKVVERKWNEWTDVQKKFFNDLVDTGKWNLASQATDDLGKKLRKILKEEKK